MARLKRQLAEANGGGGGSRYGLAYADRQFIQRMVKPRLLALNGIL
jgi:hypothetical protein